MGIPGFCCFTKRKNNGYVKHRKVNLWSIKPLAGLANQMINCPICHLLMSSQKISPDDETYLFDCCCSFYCTIDRNYGQDILLCAAINQKDFDIIRYSEEMLQIDYNDKIYSFEVGSLTLKDVPHYFALDNNEVPKFLKLKVFI